jgi:hypothetical protein
MVVVRYAVRLQQKVPSVEAQSFEHESEAAARGDRSVLSGDT